MLENGYHNQSVFWEFVGPDLELVRKPMPRRANYLSSIVFAASKTDSRPYAAFCKPATTHMLIRATMTVNSNRCNLVQGM